MKKRKVIATKNLPTRLPLMSILTVALALDHWNAPSWLWGALGLFWLIILGVAIHLKCIEEEKNLFDE